MATVSFSSSLVRTAGDESHAITWTPLENNEGGPDTGSPIEMPGSFDRSIQFFGTFGAAGVIQIEGSNDGTNYVVLTDPQGNAISKTAAAIEMIVELTRFTRPRVTSADGTTSLTAVLFLKKKR